MSLPINIAEHPDAGPDALSMDRAIARLRDEVTGIAMLRHNGHNRDLAMVMTKLDEAELWAIRYFRETGVSVTIDKRRFLTDATHTTDRSE